MDYVEHTAMRHAMSDELYHHGIMGQKWGVRRYQNPDGTLTSAGKKRYDKNSMEIVELTKRAEDILDIRTKYTERDYEQDAAAAGVANLILNNADHSMENLAQVVFSYACDDGDQSLLNSNGIRVLRSGKMNDAIEVYSKMQAANYRQYDHTSDLEFTLAQATDAYSNPYRTKEEVNKAAKEAMAIVANIDFNIKSRMGSAWNLYEAVENAGLLNVNWDDMTPSQWAAVNAELKKFY